MKKTIAILLLLFLLCGSALAGSYSIVRYEGGAEKFVFFPGSEYEKTDLFQNFKNVLPGDVLTQKIVVKNDTEGRARLYMQATPESYVTTEAKDFLDQLQLKVVSKNQELFEAAAGETAQLTERKLIGSFKSNGSTELTVTLTVPIELGSEYMGQIGVVPWTFSVEEIPEDETPDTGDWFRTGVWCGAAVLLTAAIAVLLVVQRKRRANAENE